jgi:hypothetical protein
MIAASNLAAVSPAPLPHRQHVLIAENLGILPLAVLEKLSNTFLSHLAFVRSMPMRTPPKHYDTVMITNHSLVF